MDWVYERELSNLRQVILQLEEENAKMKRAIHAFCEGSSWAAQSWKDQNHIKPLFDMDAQNEKEKA